ncbi:MAG: phage tail protein [Elainellaceae cyanobacterium]
MTQNGRTSSGTPTSAGPQINPFNYVPANRFYVQMDNDPAAAFSECSGISVKVKHDTHAEGGVNNQRRVVLGQAEFSDITLKRGVTDNMVFWDWMQSILSGTKNQRRNINILVYNQAGETMQCWTLIGAVPVGWTAPALQADSNSVAIEELTLAYEGLKVERRGQGGDVKMLSDGREEKTGYYTGGT